LLCFLRYDKEKSLIFLRPKSEPWMENDHHARKAYGKLSKAMKRACNSHPCGNEIVFVECLTMFCTVSDKATPNPMFFHRDGLHLSDEGYRVWKDVIEHHLKNSLALIRN